MAAVTAAIDEIVNRISTIARSRQHMRSGKPFLTTGQFSRSQLIDIAEREILELTWALGLLLTPAGASEDERYEAGRQYLGNALKEASDD